MASLEIGAHGSDTVPEPERKLRLVQGSEEEPTKSLVEKEKDIFSQPLGKAMLTHLRQEAPQTWAAGSYESADQ